MRKILASILTVIVLVTGLQAMTLGTPNAAFADACSDGVACIGVTVNLGAEGGSDTGIGGGGDGSEGEGTVDPPSIMYFTQPCYIGIYRPNNYCYAAISAYNGHTIKNQSPAYCPTLSDGRSPLSLTWRMQSRPKDGLYILSYTCNYPALPPDPNTVLQTVRCYTDYDAYLYQAQTKGSIAPGNGSLVGGAASPNPQLNLDAPGPNPGQGNNPGLDLNACGSFSGGAQFNLNAPQDGGYGYYRLDLNPRYRNCSLIGYPRWTGNYDADRIDCSGTIGAGTYSNYAVSACNYNYVKYGSHGSLPDNVNFAISACTDFRCVVDGSTTISGHTDPIEVMRNGENIPVKYATIHIENGPTARPEGGIGTWNIQGQTNVIDGSNPYNAATTVNGAKQYFQLKNTTGTRENFGTWEDQNRVDDFISYNWASDTGKSWALYRTWRVTNVEFYVPIPNTTGGGYTMGWQDQVIYCGQSNSNPVTVVRSVNQ